MSDPVWKDEIVEEIRRVRQAHAEEHGNDLRRIFEDFRRKQEASGRKLVALAPRPPRQSRRDAGSSS
jgi:hypothetical protein